LGVGIEAALNNKATGADKVKSEKKLPGILYAQLIAHGFCVMLSAAFSVLTLIESKGFPILKWWRYSLEQKNEIFSSDDGMPYWNYLNDAYFSLFELIVFLLLPAFMVFFWLLLRHKKTCLAPLFAVTFSKWPSLQAQCFSSLNPRSHYISCAKPS